MQQAAPIDNDPRPSSLAEVPQEVWSLILVDVEDLSIASCLRVFRGIGIGAIVARRVRAATRIQRAWRAWRASRTELMRIILSYNKLNIRRRLREILFRMNK